VVDTLTVFRPDRVGHGVRATEDPAALDRVAEAGVTLEVCPGSNVSLGVYRDATQVPLRRLVDAGIPVALGADDPLLFGTRLADQYASARHDLGFSDRELANLAQQSLRASRAPSAVRTAGLRAVADWLDAPPSRAV
jgi:adenosine deaminase